MTQATLPLMRERGVGHVIQISTVGAVGAMPFFGLYNAAKWGLEGFSEALAGEVKAFGIRVTLAELGAVDTEWATSSPQFSAPMAEYNDVREQVLGTPTVPWPTDLGATGGGASAHEVAQVLLHHVENADDGRLRLLFGSDAPEQVGVVMARRQAD